MGRATQLLGQVLEALGVSTHALLLWGGRPHQAQPPGKTRQIEGISRTLPYEREGRARRMPSTAETGEDPCPSRRREPPGGFTSAEVRADRSASTRALPSRGAARAPAPGLAGWSDVSEHERARRIHRGPHPVVLGPRGRVLPQ